MSGKLIYHWHASFNWKHPGFHSSIHEEDNISEDSKTKLMKYWWRLSTDEEKQRKEQTSWRIRWWNAYIICIKNVVSDRRMSSPTHSFKAHIYAPSLNCILFFLFYTYRIFQSVIKKILFITKVSICLNNLFIFYSGAILLPIVGLHKLT